MASARLRSAALVLALLAAGAAAWPGKKDDSIEAQLARWVTAKGGKLKGFKVGQECPTCLRGVIATKDFKPGDVIMKVPFTAVMRLKDVHHPAFAAEYARDLLDAMHNDPAHNATWDLFWRAHPGPEGTFTPEVYTDEQLAMLQTPELEALVAGQRAVTEQVYDGSYPYYSYRPFNETVGEDRVSLDTFKYVASLLGSRYFGFYRDGNTERPSSHLVPLVDLINHADDPNAERSDDTVNVLVKAINPIAKGQEITNSYQPGVIHRPDMSLYIYGFVIDREEPYLAAVDLPTFNAKDPFEQTPLLDNLYDAPGGKYVTQEELSRLRGLLAGAETTEEEDRARLDSGEVADWRIRSILTYRVMRKRALRRTIAKLEASLAASAGQGGSGGSGPAAEEQAAAAPQGQQAADEGEEAGGQEAEEQDIDEIDDRSEL
ncbi:hypothetical protein ABPG75_010621 [Micractinium tetrahymenae]